MQGKITKVLNMKPAEILGMVEEAAGTRMFEERKDKAMKTMTKKDKKVEEIESVRRLTMYFWLSADFVFLAAPRRNRSQT